MRFTTCCCWVSCRAFRNLLHWSSITSSSSTASLRSYTVVWLRTLANCLRDRTSRLSSWSNNPKSGSMTSESRHFRFLMVAVISACLDCAMHVWLHFHCKYSTDSVNNITLVHNTHGGQIIWWKVCHETSKISHAITVMTCSWWRQKCQHTQTFNSLIY